MGISDTFKKVFKKGNGEADQFKETMLLALIHRLRSPLNAARWGLESAIPKEDSPEKEILKKSYNSVIDSINIVNEVLRTAEIDSKEQLSQVRKEKIDMCGLVDHILEELAFLVKQKHITLEYRKPSNMFIRGDEKLLEIALLNLFDNAFRYSPNGKVQISLMQDVKHARLVIADNGIGIDEEDLGHMFEKFFRGKNAKKMDSNESGVGLYTTKRIVEMHAGTIGIESKLNRGTTVKVSLPLA